MVELQKRIDHHHHACIGMDNKNNTSICITLAASAQNPTFDPRALALHLFANAKLHRLITFMKAI